MKSYVEFHLTKSEGALCYVDPDSVTLFADHYIHLKNDEWVEVEENLNEIEEKVNGYIPLMWEDLVDWLDYMKENSWAAGMPIELNGVRLYVSKEDKWRLRGIKLHGGRRNAGCGWSQEKWNQMMRGKIQDKESENPDGEERCS